MIKKIKEDKEKACISFRRLSYGCTAFLFLEPVINDGNYRENPDGWLGFCIQS